MYTDRNFTRPDNQSKLWISLNPITEKFWYNTDENKTMRLIVSAPTEHPVVWSVTKIENAKPIGIQKLTLYQTQFDPAKDYIERDENGRIIGMYADYYNSPVEPTEPPRIDIPAQKNYGKIATSTEKLKVGSSSYKTLTANIFDESNIDISEKYIYADYSWTCSIDGKDFTDKVTWLNNTSAYNQIKVKFPADKSCLTKILRVKCVVTKDNEIIEAEIQLALY